MTMTADNPRRSRWIPYVLAGAAAAFIAADGVFVYLAASSSPGVITADAFEKGLAHNDLLRAASEQAELGWAGALDVAEAGREIRVRLLGPDGRPVVGATLGGTVGRPTQSGEDRTLTFVDLGGGRYKAVVDPLAAGQWEIAILAEQAGKRFQMVERMVLK